MLQTWAEKPEIAIGPERQMPEELKLKLMKGASASQLEFWKLNLKALKAKEEAQLQYLRALAKVSGDFENALCDEKTCVGSGYSGTLITFKHYSIVPCFPFHMYVLNLVLFNLLQITPFLIDAMMCQAPTSIIPLGKHDRDPHLFRLTAWDDLFI